MLDLGEFEDISPTVIAAYLDAMGWWKEYGYFSLSGLRELSDQELSELEAMAFERWSFETDSEFDDALARDVAIIRNKKRRSR